MNHFAANHWAANHWRANHWHGVRGTAPGKQFYADGRFDYTVAAGTVEYIAEGTYGVAVMDEPTDYVAEERRFEETVEAGVCEYVVPDGRFEYGDST